MSPRFAIPLLSRFGRRRRAARAPEPADMGTAFGMEQWLDEIEDAAIAPAPVRGSARPRAGWPTWWPRWWQGSTAR
ncbi:MAG: hypothetical protein KBC73_20370 [Burkholderiaceae bacterium]|nr:hypothetical protein [Burkholderiaceae bacterium]